MSVLNNASGEIFIVTVLGLQLSSVVFFKLALFIDNGRHLFLLGFLQFPKLALSKVLGLGVLFLEVANLLAPIDALLCSLQFPQLDNVDHFVVLALYLALHLLAAAGIAALFHNLPALGLQLLGELLNL